MILVDCSTTTALNASSVCRCVVRALFLCKSCAYYIVLASTHLLFPLLLPTTTLSLLLVYSIAHRFVL